MALTIDDLGVVREELYEARTKCYDIGLALKLPVATLDSIEGQFDNHSEKLREILKVWLKTATEHSWQDIVDVLKRRVVAEPKLASDIEAKHCTTAETGQASGPMMPAAKRPKTTDTMLEQALQENRELRIKDQDSQRRIGTLQLELHLQESQREVEELTRQMEEDYQEQQITKAKHRKDLQKHQQTNQELRTTNDQLKRQLQQQQATEKNLLEDLQKHVQTIQQLRAMKNLLEFQLKQKAIEAVTRTPVILKPARVMPDNRPS